MTDSPEITEPLPSVIPVFPLPKAILFPSSNLPLNIFEQRYLKMVEDAWASHKIIGMIQPQKIEEDGTPAQKLYSIGCAGKISHLVKTEDGRYLIRLTGIIRFRIEDELSVTTPYRQVKADWEPFSTDMEPLPEHGCFDRKPLMSVLKGYLDSRGLAADYDGINTAPDGVLINTLSMIIPFSMQEKQALLEAEDTPKRAETLKNLLIMSSANGKAH
ncbi:LON peptidase substrate-binding domain-containing protein [Kordiimonas pumila]|uniref:LON peptidase substrate-binding domain-containing protein n=1 Tax=Kordiimonas pumila TaxID=2161677 RepID=A0ABV7D5E3_9PROT|nr:LON peptidase substrate-binding domain-containing protein [Kordiimonas pumila]